MAEELNLEDTDLPDNEIDTEPQQTETSAFQSLLDRLEKIQTLPTPNATSKKQMLSQFLALWSEILQISPSDAQSCYSACSRVLPRLLKMVNFYYIRKDIKVARETCFTCISQLNQPNMRYYLQLTTEQQELPENKIYSRHVYYLLLFAAQTVSILPFSIVEDRQFIENHLELYSLLIEKIDQSMPSHCQTTEEKELELDFLCSRILGLLWNTADRTILIPILLKCDLAKKAIDWLAQASKLTTGSCRPLISIIHNIARHDDGADELNKYGAIDIIKQYQKIKVQKVDTRVLISSMALALLSTPEELKRNQKGMNIVLNQLLQLVIHAAKGDRFRKDGFHVSEPLCVLVKLFVVEERTIDYTLCHAETQPPSDTHSTISLFASLLFKFSNALNGTDQLEQFTLTALLNIFWSISFQPNYTSELMQDQELLTTIQKFVDSDQGNEVLEQYKPRSMEGVRQAAHGILHNLNQVGKKEDVVSKSKITINNLVSINEKKTEKKPWIMISYCHADDNFCTQVLNLLIKYNDTFNIWIDRTHCQGAEDLWELIAEGMENASVIVSLLSNQYFESKSCRKEFIYATDSLKKKVLPVLIESFEPKGWLGIRMTGIKYVRFRGSFESEQNKINELVNTILSSFSSTPSSNEQNILTPVVIPHESLPLKETSSPQSISLNIVRPVEQWTSTNGDIHAWFANNQISTQLRNLFNFQSGEEMVTYAQMLIKDREKHLNIYSKIYAQTYNGNDLPPHEFNRFTNALEKLLKDSGRLPLNTESSNRNKSSTCVIF